MKNDLKYHLNTKYNFEKEDCNIVSIHLLKHNTTIFAVYRPPQNKCNLFLPELDKPLENQKDSCIIIGDFNLDLLKGSQYINLYKSNI